MAYGGGVYIIKRLAHLVVDAKNDSAGLDLLCDYMTASFDGSIVILSRCRVVLFRTRSDGG